MFPKKTLFQKMEDQEWPMFSLENELRNPC